MSSRRITIFDTTLRDGEQAPGIALRPDEKVEIARAARAAWRRCDRGRLRGLLARRLRGCPRGRAGGETRHRRLALPRELDRHRRRGGRARGCAALAHPHLPRDQRAAHGEEASPHARRGRRRTRRPRSRKPARASTRSSSPARTRPDPTPSSSPPSAGLPWRPAQRRSTSRTPSATCCRPSTRRSSCTCASGAPSSSTSTLSAHCHDDLGLAVANSLAALDCRRAAARVHGERHRRAGRQCLARGDRDGDARARRRPAGPYRHRPVADRPRLPPRRAAHELPRPSQQGDRRRERLRARGRHPPGRAAQGRRAPTRSSTRASSAW